MTRVYVYSSALVAFAAGLTCDRNNHSSDSWSWDATAMTIASISIPNWVSYSVTTPKGDKFEKHIGLHKSCSNLDSPTCRDFPTAELCRAGERYFCSMWKTVGFMASLSAILCLACLLCFAVVLNGGKYKRETGWPFVTGMLSIVSVVQFAIISIVAYLFENDDQFTIPGWNLDVSWILTTVSASVCLLAALGLTLSAYLLPPEEGYEFLEDPLGA